MDFAYLLLFLMRIVVLNEASEVEIDDIIADAVQETYKEPLRKICTGFNIYRIYFILCPIMFIKADNSQAFSLSL